MSFLELIDQLPDHERLVIVLKHFEGHTASEIALITGSRSAPSLNNFLELVNVYSRVLQKEKSMKSDLSLDDRLERLAQELVGHGSKSQSIMNEIAQCKPETIMQGVKVLDTNKRRNSGRLIFIAVAASVVFAWDYGASTAIVVCSSG